MIRPAERSDGAERLPGRPFNLKLREGFLNKGWPILLRRGQRLAVRHQDLQFAKVS